MQSGSLVVSFSGGTVVKFYVCQVGEKKRPVALIKKRTEAMQPAAPVKTLSVHSCTAGK
jgi:hypothetical protein